MFDPTKPIEATPEILDKIVRIKKEIAIELEGFEGDLNSEWNRLFQEKISQDEELSKIENTL